MSDGITWLSEPNAIDCTDHSVVSARGLGRFRRAGNQRRRPRQSSGRR
ncbi:hypothetical protein [Streptomyces carpinensis]|uniref:Uncharacterized protein n=1 Tax=Streptomyces carpinensis TaxID=66369 RepID=A0ABV1WDK9_9ACTN|nr:hypothetical protein [Streptomyces carpinensis]